MRSLPSLVMAVALAVAAHGARAETPGAPLVIETRPLKLIGDGTAPATPPAQPDIAITTPPLRLFGDGAGPARDRETPAPLTIETRPLKLIGAKP